MRERSVFINCPFDDEFKPFFHRIIFAIIDCGFVARSALEVYNSGNVRFGRIIEIIKQTKYSVHDISRTQLDEHNNLPRFNMPFELGLCMGAKEFGSRFADNDILILESEPFRYQEFISDLNGFDPKPHENSPDNVFDAIRAWLEGKESNAILPGPEVMAEKFVQYQQDLPAICNKVGLTPASMRFRYHTHFTLEWLQDRDSRHAA